MSIHPTFVYIAGFSLMLFNFCVNCVETSFACAFPFSFYPHWIWILIFYQHHKKGV